MDIGRYQVSCYGFRHLGDFTKNISDSFYEKTRSDFLSITLEIRELIYLVFTSNK